MARMDRTIDVPHLPQIPQVRAIREPTMESDAHQRAAFIRPERCLLAIRRHGKPIPYHAVQRPPPDSSNEGFRVLKGRPSDEALAIKEVADVEALQRFVIDINRAESGFFSVGCEKAFNFDPRCGHWGRGYVEFSFNDSALVVDAQKYFKLFFEFSAVMSDPSAPKDVYYCWELDGAHFTSVDLGGFTCAVWIQTDDFDSEVAARAAWSNGLDFLTEFLNQFDHTPVAPIY